jgi:hypothetical protein
MIHPCNTTTTIIETTTALTTTAWTCISIETRVIRLNGSKLHPPPVTCTLDTTNATTLTAELTTLANMYTSNNIISQQRPNARQTADGRKAVLTGMTVISARTKWEPKKGPATRPTTGVQRRLSPRFLHIRRPRQPDVHQA